MPSTFTPLPPTSHVVFENRSFRYPANGASTTYGTNRRLVYNAPRDRSVSSVIAPEFFSNVSCPRITARIALSPNAPRNWPANNSR